MKISGTISCGTLVGCLAMFGFLGSASAQSSIQIVAEPFQANPVIPFAPATKNGVKPETAPVVEPPAPVEPVAPREVWSIKSGTLLRNALLEWTVKAGWSFVWGLPEQDDFRLNSGNSYGEDFRAAVTGLINSLPATVRIRVELRTDNVPPLLFVTNEEGTR